MSTSPIAPTVERIRRNLKRNRGKLTGLEERHKAALDAERAELDAEVASDVAALKALGVPEEEPARP